MQKLVSKNPVQRFKQGRKIVKALWGIDFDDVTSYLASGIPGVVVNQLGKATKKATKKGKDMLLDFVIPGRTSEKRQQEFSNYNEQKKKEDFIKFYEKEEEKSKNPNLTKVSGTFSGNSKNNSSLVKPSIVVSKRPLKTKEQWDSDFNNAKNQLTPQQLMYLDQLGIDTSSAEKMQQGINAYNKNSGLVVDNKWGDKSSAALSKILNSMPNDYRNEDTLQGLDNEKNIPNVVEAVVQKPIKTTYIPLSNTGGYGSNFVARDLKTALGNNNNYQGLVDFVWNNQNPEYQGIADDLKNMFSQYNSRNHWLYNQDDIMKALNISGRFRGTRSGDYGDIARALARYNGIKDYEVDRFNQSLKYKQGGQLVSRNPITRFKNKKK